MAEQRGKKMPFFPGYDVTAWGLRNGHVEKVTVCEESINRNDFGALVPVLIGMVGVFV